VNPTGPLIATVGPPEMTLIANGIGVKPTDSLQNAGFDSYRSEGTRARPWNREESAHAGFMKDARGRSRSA
jgi:hypothetical protein